MRKSSARLDVTTFYGSFAAARMKAALRLYLAADRNVARRHKLLHNSRRFDTSGVMNEHVI